MKKENNPFKSSRREFERNPVEKVLKSKKDYSRKNMKDFNDEDLCVHCGKILKRGEIEECEKCVQDTNSKDKEDVDVNYFVENDGCND